MSALQELKVRTLSVTLVYLGVSNRMKIKSIDVLTEDKIDKAGSIFMSSGDQAITYCLAHENAIRSSYTDGNSLYPKIGDTVVTYEDGSRAIKQ